MQADRALRQAQLGARGGEAARPSPRRSNTTSARAPAISRRAGPVPVGRGAGSARLHQNFLMHCLGRIQEDPRLLPQLILSSIAAGDGDGGAGKGGAMGMDGVTDPQAVGSAGSGGARPRARAAGWERAARVTAAGPSASAGAAAYPPYIRRGIPPYEIASETQLVAIERAAERILSEIGIEFRGDAEALRLFREAGARIDGVRARFDPGNDPRDPGDRAADLHPACPQPCPLGFEIGRRGGGVRAGPTARRS